MKKAVIALFVALAVLIIGLVGGYLKLLNTVKTQVANTDKISFLGNSYTRYEEQSDFSPFGEQNRAWSNIDKKVKFKSLLGLSYCKTDENKNFIYNESMYGEDIFIREGYTVPKYPEPDNIDAIEVRFFKNDLWFKIYNREDINSLVSYSNEIKDEYELEVSNKGSEGLWIYGVSHKDGGVFTISYSYLRNDDGEIFFVTMDGNKFPVSDEIESLLNGYISENS